MLLERRALEARLEGFLERGDPVLTAAAQPDPEPPA